MCKSRDTLFLLLNFRVPGLIAAFHEAQARVHLGKPAAVRGRSLPRGAAPLRQPPRARLLLGDDDKQPRRGRRARGQRARAARRASNASSAARALAAASAPVRCCSLSHGAALLRQPPRARLLRGDDNEQPRMRAGAVFLAPVFATARGAQGGARGARSARARSDLSRGARGARRKREREVGGASWHFIGADANRAERRA